MSRVTYKGPADGSPAQGGVVVDDYEFPLGREVEVEDEELVSEITQGSERLSAFEFEVQSD